MINLKYLWFLLIFSQIVSSQTNKEFLIEINENNYIPKLDKKNNTYKVSNSLKDAGDINELLLILEIVDVININDIDINEQKNLIKINISQTDTELINLTLNNLITNYTYYQNFEEVETFESLSFPPPSYTPQDFETAIGPSWLTHNNQNDLILIRAQEAWHLTHGNENVLIGVADTNFNTSHIDLATEIVGGIGNYTGGTSGNGHGSEVAGYASGATDNDIGTSASIGFNTKMLVVEGSSVHNLKLLSLAGAKVVNGSFGGNTSDQYVYNGGNLNTQNLIDDIINNGTVVIFAAGNGPFSGGTSNLDNGVISNETYANRYYLPASYRDVISVSSVGHLNDIGSTTIENDNWKDVHDFATSSIPGTTTYSGTNTLIEEANISHQHNDSIDIVVPAFNASPKIRHNTTTQFTNMNRGGTSYSAPIVAGTVGLMFSVNYCLDPKEVESILKLTAVKIDTIPQNSQYYGKLGAGRLDAFEAVKMAKDMADTFGTVEVKNRILYRWFYKLVSAPYKIKMTNNNVTGNARLKFRAKDNIEILSGEYFPGTGGYIDLKIDNSLTTCLPPTSISRALNQDKTNDKFSEDKFKVFPTLVLKDLNILSKSNHYRNINSIIIFDFYGSEVFRKDHIDSNNKINLKLNNLQPGLYILKIFDKSDSTLHIEKIVKK